MAALVADGSQNSFDTSLVHFTAALEDVAEAQCFIQVHTLLAAGWTIYLQRRLNDSA